MKLTSGSTFLRKLPGGNSRFARRFAGAAFLFFLIKGLVWLGIFAAAAWAAFRVS